MYENLVAAGAMTAEMRRHLECPWCTHLQSLTESLADVKLWMEVQPEGSMAQDQFRERVRQLTEAKLAAEQSVRVAVKVRPGLAEARDNVRLSRRAVDSAGDGTRPSVWALVIGAGVLLFGMLVVEFWAIWLFGLLALMGGVAGLWFTIRRRRLAEEDLADDRAALRAVEDEMAELMPGPVPVPKLAGG